MKCILILSIFCISTAAAQDQIITLSGDTLACHIMEAPWKKGLRLAGKKGRWQNGYKYIVTIWNNDSVRVLEPRHIKGFYKKEHSRWLSGGYYASVRFAESIPVLFKGVQKSRFPEHNFLRRIFQSDYLSVYETMLPDIGEINLLWFVKFPEDSTYHQVRLKKDMRALLKTNRLCSKPEPIKSLKSATTNG